MALLLPACVVLDMLHNTFEPARVGRIRDYRHKEKYLVNDTIIFQGENLMTINSLMNLLLYAFQPKIKVNADHRLLYLIDYTTKSFFYIHLLLIWWLILCQPDWASEIQDSWSNIILCVSVRVFLDEINF